ALPVIRERVGVRVCRATAVLKSSFRPRDQSEPDRVGPVWTEGPGLTFPRPLAPLVERHRTFGPTGAARPGSDKILTGRPSPHTARDESSLHDRHLVPLPVGRILVEG